jgi:hypothetical protein
MEMKLEVVPIPVSDVNAATAFFTLLGRSRWAVQEWTRCQARLN